MMKSQSQSNFNNGKLKGETQSWQLAWTKGWKARAGGVAFVWWERKFFKKEKKRKEKSRNAVCIGWQKKPLCRGCCYKLVTGMGLGLGLGSGWCGVGRGPYVRSCFVSINAFLHHQRFPASSMLSLRPRAGEWTFIFPFFLSLSLSLIKNLIHIFALLIHFLMCF